MRLLQKYPWLVPDDGEEWVPVEASAIIEAAYDSLDRLLEIPARPAWPRSIVEFTLPTRLRERVLLVCGWTDKADEVRGVLQSVRAVGNIEATSEVITTAHIASVSGSKPIDIGMLVIGLNSDGVVVSGSYNHRQHLDDETHEDYLLLTIACLQAVFAFLNCKNVTVVDEEVPPAVRRKRAKKGRDIIYKQLVVDGKPIVRRPGQKESKEDADFRYHICRGHFADHREHGLFGKESLKGVYWVPMHVKGSRRNGEVIKDYLVKP